MSKSLHTSLHTSLNQMTLNHMTLNHMTWIKTITNRTRRGISLIELLLAIGIVLAIAALVIPWTAGWLGSRELDNAEDGLTLQFMRARAAAREGGRPVQVIAKSDESGNFVQASYVANGGEEEPFDGVSLAASDSDSDANLLRPINADWASMKLPSGVCIALSGTDGSSDGDDMNEELGSAEDDVPPPAVGAEGQTLAIFLPDGSVFFAPIFMLRTDAGSLRAMKVDRATGVPQAVQAKTPASDANNVERPEFDAPRGAKQR